jgi:hypothetical protein
MCFGSLTPAEIPAADGTVESAEEPAVAQEEPVDDSLEEEEKSEL